MIALLALLGVIQGRLLADDVATAVAAVAGGFVAGITVTSGGSGYDSEPTVFITGGGGTGATAKALVGQGKVLQVVVLTAGTGYTAPPDVVIGAPPKRFGMRMELVPKITVEGPPGSSARVEWASSLSGPWTIWTNVFVEANGTVLVDLAPGGTERFYQSVSTTPVGPPGFVWITPGTFVMGSPTNEVGRGNDEAQHQVTLTRGFWMCDHEVTRGELARFGGSIPSQNTDDVFPVEQLHLLPVIVSWYGADGYCQKLTEVERAAGRIGPQHCYRLPTEAEWEYAARAGTKERFYDSDLKRIAWFSQSAQIQYAPHPVKTKAPNNWGLYDMLGNVTEWVSDWYGPYSYVPISDPTGVPGPPAGSKIYRGGQVGFPENELRAANRQPIAPLSVEQGYGSGFRVVLSTIP